MPSLSTAKLIGFGLGLIALLGCIYTALSWRAERNELREWRGQVVAATVDAAGLKDSKGRPAKLKPKDVPQQIRFLGEALSAVRLKTAQAQADDAAHARAVEQRQAKISQEASNDYQKQLTAVRADYAERVRKARAAATNQSRGGNPSVSSQPGSAGRPDATASEDRLPPADALIATEQALQLQALQKWVRDVLK